ncbi:MAG: glutamine synthetase III [Prevotellaceae bacterium]|jgi:glutamine synthetase|nr:glutamine synthetase III [Prevotellaceae bacterium]
MSKLRFKVLKEASLREAVKVEKPSKLPSELFESQVFTRDTMRKYIDADVLESLFEAIDKGKPIGRELASAVANGMKKWAVELGATHYTHWFQPLTGGTAEKHDAFINKEPNGKALEEFTGKLLYQQEPDASSFPSGGIRNTFEARGYTAWDPSSPVFVVGDTLCIPTVFVAYTGEALDYKAPLLRSISVINKAATDVCKYFDRNVSRVYSYLGWEQEYFLVDEALYAARPDLMLTGRTLMGHTSAKNQQLEDHYFGSIPERVLNFMTELEIEALKLGIPVKTRHNEVAPNQFELAPIYEECNLANDHNLLLMSLMEKIARKHHFRVLLHEKPFAGVNGSGKHNNWSIGTNTGVNLLSPGKNAAANLQFVTFLVNILMAVHKHNALLKASISSASNAHRLGANEAPPAIVSVFLGTQITETLDKLEKATTDEAIFLNAKKEMKLNVGNIPEILLDNTDRNRTSPFAFTGNRFEFRAVGSSANCGAAMLALNAVVANQLITFKKEVDAMLNKGEAKESALFTVIKKYIKESKNIRYDGNGYSDEWKSKAEKRGLDCETSVPKIFDAYITPETIKMFSNTHVLTKKELESRCEVKWETYTKKIQIEARVLGDLVVNHIVPVANRYQSFLLDNVVKMREVFGKESENLTEQDRSIIRQIAEHTSTIIAKVDEMVEARKVANKIDSEREKAIAYHDKIVPLLDEIRTHVDKLELVVDDEMWALPKYRELLFIR